MGKILTSLLMAALSIPSAYSAYVTGNVLFKGVIPENGSKIENFDFTYKFDITDVEAKNPKYEWHTDWYTISERNTQGGVELWEGEIGTGKLLYRLHEENSLGTDTDAGNLRDGFEKDGDVKVVFKSLVPKPGQKYTVRTAHQYVALSQRRDEKPYGGGGTVEVGTAELPIIYTFTGSGTLNPDKCLYLGSDMSWAELCHEFSSIKFHFNAPVNVVSNENIILKTYGEDDVVSLSAVTDPEDASSVIVNFPTKVLTSKKYYTVIIPEGSIRNASNPESVNVEIKHLLKGEPLTLGDDPYQMLTFGKAFDKINIRLNLPAGVKLTGQKNLKYKIYAGSDVAGTPLKDYMYIDVQEGSDILSFPLNFQYSPDTEYTLVVPATVLKIEKMDIYGSTLDLSELRIPFHTATLEEGKSLLPSNAPTFKWGKAINGGYNYKEPAVVENEASLEAISPYLQIAPEGYKVKVSNTIWDVQVKDASKLIRLIEVDDNGDEIREIKTCAPGTVKNEDVTDYLYFACANFGKPKLYEGFRYKLIIPEGEFTLYPKGYGYYGAYISSPAYEIILNGASESSLPVVTCNIENGAQLSELKTIRVRFNGYSHLAAENTKLAVKSQGKDINTVSVKAEQGPRYGTTTYPAISQTALVLNFGNSFYDDAVSLTNGTEYTLTIPAKTLLADDDDQIGNAEYVINFTGASGAQEIVMHPVSLSLSDYVKVAFSAQEGKEITVDIAPDEFWEIESLTDGDEDRSSELQNGKITLMVSSPVSLVANLKYKGELVLTDTSGIATLPESGVKVASDGDNIVIDGLTEGDSVMVYTVGGIVIASHTAQSDRLQIEADKGQTYIVRVNKQAAKIMH